jgi:hypothetical protein
MELRSCNHLHFIQVVQGGLVTKIPNITRGRPALKIKMLQEIYEAVDVKNHNMLPTLRPKIEFESFSFDGGRVEVKSSRLHMVDRRTIKREPETSDLFCNGGDKRINSDSNDSGFGNMTLKQIKERCKAKKRKRSKHVELSKETSKTSSSLEQVQTEEEDFDLKEPLSSLKSRLSKNKKAKKKHMKRHVSTSPQTAISIVKSEQVPSDEVLPQSGGDLWPAINIKVDVPEPDCSDCQNIGGDPSLLCDEPGGSSGMVSSELCETANEYVSENQVSILLTTEPKYCVTNEVCYESMEPADSKSFQNVRLCDEPGGSSGMVSSELCETANEYVSENQVSILLTKEPKYCVTNEACYEYMEPADSKSFQNVRLCDEPGGSSGMVSSELCETANEYVSENQVSILLTKEPKYCVTNEACYEYMEPADSKSFQNVMSPCEDSVKPDNTETTRHGCSDLPIPESEIEIDPVPSDTSTEIISSMTDHSSYISDISQSSPCMNEVLDNGNDIKAQVPLMTIHKSPQGMEVCGGGDACVFEDSITADLPSNPEVSVMASSTSDRSLSPDSCLGSIEDDSPSTGENEPTKSACANVEINVSGGIHPSDATDELIKTVGFGYCHSKLQHPPERLFATRKVCEF